MIRHDTYPDSVMPDVCDDRSVRIDVRPALSGLINAHPSITIVLIEKSGCMGIKELRQVFGLDPRKLRAAQIILIIGSVRVAGVFFPKRQRRLASFAVIGRGAEKDCSTWEANVHPFGDGRNFP